jgi:hypothetical protein
MGKESGVLFPRCLLVEVLWDMLHPLTPLHEKEEEKEKEKEKIREKDKETRVKVKALGRRSSSRLATRMGG